jgi:DNA modification methylase
MRNKRTVWTVASQGYEGAHFATFPPKLIEPCILAGCPVGGVVLDPFMGSGTTGLVSMKHGRAFIGIELNEDYIKMAIDRLSQPALPMQFEQVEQGHCSGEASVFGQSVLPLGA